MGHSFRLLTLTGDPAERGLQYGQAAKDQIRDGLDFYGAVFGEAGIGPVDLQDISLRIATAIDAFDPDLLVELEGVAHGSDVTLAEVISLNARTELLRIADEGCTAIACMPERTVDGHTLLAQNWDWHPSRRHACVLLRILPTAGPAMLTFGEAGALARFGINEHGIGVVGNALQSADGAREGGIPVALVRRSILNSASLAEAVEVVRRTPAGSSTNHLIASAEGWAISCEVTATRMFEVEPVVGLLEHSNHFRSPEAQATVVDTGIARTPDTLARDTRIHHLLDADRPIEVADVETALRDHQGFPNSICRHAGTVTSRTWTTNASVVMDLDERCLRLAEGPVCEHSYVLHRLQ